MATVDWEIAKVLLAGNGYYPGDDQAYAIYRYENDFDGDYSYSICYDARACRSLEQSPACHNPQLLWGRACGLTTVGSTEIRAHVDRPIL